MSAPAERPLRAPRWAMLMCLAAAALPFTFSLPQYAFLSDDFGFLARWRPGLALADFTSSIFRSTEYASLSFYRPLFFLTLFLQFRLFGENAFWFHVFDLVLHLVNVALLVFLVQAIVGPPRRLAAGLLAVLYFALSPRRVEAVSWISSRADLLAAFFCLAAALVVARGLQRGSLIRQGPLAALCWFFALLSKESAAALPLFLIPVYLGRGEKPKGLARTAAAFVGTLCLYLCMRMSALSELVGGYGVQGWLPTPAAAVRGSAEYLLYSIVPAIPALEPYPLGSPAGKAIAAASAVLLLCIVALIWRSRRDPAVRWGSLWFAAAVLPVVGLKLSLITTFNDRLLYLPAIGTVLVLAGLLQTAPRLLLVVCGLLLPAIGYRQALTAGHWAAAAHLAREYRNWLDQERAAIPAGQPLFLAAAPDSFRGAYVLRNALPAMFVNSQGKGTEAVFPLSYYMAASPDEIPATVDPAAEGVTIKSSSPKLFPAPQAAGLFEVMPVGNADRFGRYAQLTVRLGGAALVLGQKKSNRPAAGVPR